MLVILPVDRYDAWLDPEFQDAKVLITMLVSYEADKLEAYPVSTLVNSPKNERAECVEQIDGV